MKNTIRSILILGLLVFTLRPSAAMGQFFFLENESVGKPAKNFTLRTVGGKTLNLAEFRNGQKAVIFFWATWCPHCRRELEGLSRNKEQIARKGIAIILVDVGEGEGDVRQYLQKSNIAMDVFLDTDSSVSESYGVMGIPTFYLVDREGIVRDVQHSLPENYEEIVSAPVK